MEPPPLVAVCACLERRSPRAAAIAEVKSLVSKFLDASPRFSLPDAAATGSVALFERVVLNDPHDDALLRTNLFTLAMKNAIAGQHTAVVKRIHELHPEPLGLHAFAAAGRVGAVDILQWLFENRSDGLCVKTPPARHGRPLNCCMRVVVERAGRGRRRQVLGWLIDCAEFTHVEDRDVIELVQSDDVNRLIKLEQAGGLERLNLSTEEWLEKAAESGSQRVIRWLCETRSIQPTPEAGAVARCRGHMETAAFLDGVAERRRKLPQGWCSKAGRGPLGGGQALMSGDYEFVKAVWSQDQHPLNASVLPFFFKRDHLRMIVWMHERGAAVWSHRVMDRAAMYGHLDVVQWLHRNRTEGGTKAAMDGAAANGFLEVVIWLHANRKEGCSTRAMDGAAKNGKLEVMKWLHANRTEGCTVNAMNEAAGAGHVDVINWLHNNRREGCSSKALVAVLRGCQRLDVVSWLCDHYVMKGISLPPMGSLDDIAIVQWLANRSLLLWHHASAEDAAFYGKVWLLELLERSGAAKLFPRNVWKSIEFIAITGGHSSAIQWVHRCRNAES